MLNRAAFRAVVYGLVQGVNYRYFVQRYAEAIGLTGCTSNLSDGSVEVIAEGEKVKLERLIAKLKIGPRASHVERVDVEWLEYSGKYSQFYIVY